jgi:hypothetical protein
MTNAATAPALLCHGSLRRTASWLSVSRSSIIAVVGLGCRALVRVRLSWCASVVLSVPRDEIRKCGHSSSTIGASWRNQLSRVDGFGIVFPKRDAAYQQVETLRRQLVRIR